jgi:hypothetical protein
MLINKLLTMPKKVTNPCTREKTKGKHVETNYTVEDEDNQFRFNLYLRRNILIYDDFSCGLSWNMPSGETITLTRYNGSSHNHFNCLDNEYLGYNCHIHKSTERYTKAGKKSDGYATNAKERYYTLEGALYCLAKDCNIKGLSLTPDQPNLFP